VIGVWDSRRGIKSVKNVLDNKDKGRQNILVANVEAFSSMDSIRHACANILQRGESTLVIDESVTLKTEDAIRTRVLKILRPMATKARILSGLPTPRSPLDIWSQFEFLRPGLLGFSSYTGFEQRYAVIRHMRVGGKYSIKVPVRYTDNINELWDKLSPWSYRKLLKDCTDVPEKLYVTREVEMTPEQERIYREMDENATAEVLPGVFMTSQQSITTTLRLHQLCCGWVTDEAKNVYPVPENRTKSLVELLADFDGKAVIWCSYTRDLQKVVAALRKEFGEWSTVDFYGHNRKTREANSRQFKEDEQCRFMVATPASGGRVRDWSEASLIVYYSNTDNLEHRDQSEERASGMGKQDRVTVIDFMTRDTVEYKIIYAMRKKIDLATVVLQDPKREWVV
jgi:SNF2 family DNA or RNA helicase